jgi:hypothetical protein
MWKKLICAIAIVLLGALALAVLPDYFRDRGQSAASSCINTLRQLDGAKQQWQLEHNKTTNDIPSLDDMKVYVKLTSSNEIPACPQGGIYVLGRLGEPPRCSIGGQGHTVP